MEAYGSGIWSRADAASTEAAHTIRPLPPFPGDSRMIAVPGINGDVDIWDIQTGEVHKTNGGGGFIGSIAFSPDGKTLASAGDEQSVVDDHTVRLWNTSTYDCIGSLTGHTTNIWCVAFSADGKWLASGGTDELLIWDLSSKSLRRRIDRAAQCLDRRASRRTAST